MLEIKEEILKTAVFYLTYGCNDTCEFCFVKDKINKAPQMSFEEIQNNFYFLQSKQSLNGIILSGGEPTLHPEFFQIMDFFYHTPKLHTVSLNTNALKLAQEGFFEQLLAFYKQDNFPIIDTMVSVSVSTIHSFPPESGIEKMKLKGIEKAIELFHQTNTSLVLVLTITKQNYQILPELIEHIVTEQKKWNPQKKIILQFRNLYLEDYMSAKQKELTFETDFELMRPFIETSIQKIHDSNSFVLRMFNLPFCYFQKEIIDLCTPEFESMKKDIRFHIDCFRQFSKIKEEGFHRNSWMHDECKQCTFKNSCNKIQPEYLKLEHYPKIKSI